MIRKNQAILYYWNLECLFIQRFPKYLFAVPLVIAKDLAETFDEYISRHIFYVLIKLCRFTNGIVDLQSFQ